MFLHKINDTKIQIDFASDGQFPNGEPAFDEGEVLDDGYYWREVAEDGTPTSPWDGPFDGPKEALSGATFFLAYKDCDQDGDLGDEDSDDAEDF